MKKSPFLSNPDLDLSGKTVLVRIDCDEDLRQQGEELIVDEDFRLKTAIPTIQVLEEKGVKKIILCGHLGRPDGKPVSELSLEPISNWFTQNFKLCPLVTFDNIDQENTNLVLLENLRFHPGERQAGKDFTQKLASLADVYVNDTFATSHRDHASITKVPQILPGLLGLRFELELRTLDDLIEDPDRPLVFVIGGSKADKVSYLDFLQDWTDTTLVGGKLPVDIKKQSIDYDPAKINVAILNDQKLDISKETISIWEGIIDKAATIVWAGPLGKYEQEPNHKGTQKIMQAIIQSSACKIAGGGDTHRLISRSDVWKEFDFVSVGGGALLTFLKDQSLLGLEAVLSSPEVS